MSYIWLPDDGSNPVSARNEILYYVELASLFFILFLVAAVNRYAKIFKTKKIKNKIANLSKDEPIVRESSGSFDFLKNLKK